MGAQEDIKAMLADLRATDDDDDVCVKATELLRAMHSANPEAKLLRFQAAARLKAKGRTLQELADLMKMSRSQAQAVAEGRSRSGKRSEVADDMDDDDV